jgi:hypothetical protein
MFGGSVRTKQLGPSLKPTYPGTWDGPGCSDGHGAVILRDTSRIALAGLLCPAGLFSDPKAADLRGIGSILALDLRRRC